MPPEIPRNLAAPGAFRMWAFDCLSAVLAAVFFCALAAAQQAPPPNYDESRAGTFALPDPLVFANGKPVRTSAQWLNRRGELLRLFEENVYGRTPKPPRHLRFRVFDRDAHALGGKALREQVTIYFSAKKDTPHEDLLIYIPAGAPKPVPLILSLNFQGNQAVIDEPGVKLATLWDRRTHQPSQAREQSRGRDPGFEVRKVLDQGYGFATICYQDIEPDFEGGMKYGVRALFLKAGQTEPGPGEWGAIGAWAYGLSRAMDYLVQDKNVDAHRVAIMGHSRLGKTVLWAAARDPRFALALSSCPGEGGASLWRRNYGETIESMSHSFRYWFCPNLWKFTGRVGELPVDAHELIALIAPRPVYITSAEDDQWADPRGMFLACIAAGPVYKLLGAQGLDTDKMPPLNQPIQHTIAFHYRTGKHAVTAFDWDQFLAFADAHFGAR